MTIRTWMLACALGAGLAAPALGYPGSFTATLSVSVGSLPPISISGSGIGQSSTNGGTAGIPAGVFSIGETQILPTPLLGIVFGFGIAGPGQVGAQAPFADGANLAFQFDGSTGTMGLSASAYLLNAKNKAIAGIPLSIIGVGGTQTFVAIPGLASGTIHANPWQLGMVTAMGSFGGTPSTAFGTGFDNRDANGEGTLQVVTPTVIDLGGLGSLAAIATMTMGMFTPIPEPGTVVLLAAGLAALGLSARRAREL